MQEVIPGGPTFANGYLNVSDASGLGTDVNEKLAATYPYQRAYLPTTRRLDGSVHDWWADVTVGYQRSSSAYLGET